MAAVDDDILRRIGQLVEEEHRLQNTPEETDPDRLRDLEVMLDQCWDLLRQRRARRGAGQDPDEATVRPAREVENYRQ